MKTNCIATKNLILYQISKQWDGSGERAMQSVLRKRQFGDNFSSFALAPSRRELALSVWAGANIDRVVAE